MAELRRTPLYEWHIAHGARMTAFAGWSMPLQYTGIVQEHRAVRTEVGMFDISHMGRLRCRGADAAALLDLVCTNAIAPMTIGQVRYSLICHERGGVLDDVLVYRWGTNEFGLVVNAANHDKILQWLEQHRGNRSVEIVDETMATAMVAVQGPAAVTVVADLFADDIRSLKYYHACRTQHCAVPVWVSRTGYTGEDGFEIVMAATEVQGLWQHLAERGVIPCGLGARDTLRLEAGMPLYGQELTEQINPIQAGLTWAVKFTKGDFIGRAALERARNDASLPVRVGLEIEGRRAARPGHRVLSVTGEPVGTVTSGSFCPWLELSLAMAYVMPRWSAVGTPLQIEVPGANLQAAVVPLPFYSRKPAAS
ncbi:MAG: glycine cleavage system aminomethyltransferase GcvT [Gemmataceae bacterium]|nr:glycine cleavage system aminomethyltransferase GcvT [Gemmataceae bacterium]